MTCAPTIQGSRERRTAPREPSRRTAPATTKGVASVRIPRTSSSRSGLMDPDQTWKTVSCGEG